MARVCCRVLLASRLVVTPAAAVVLEPARGAARETTTDSSGEYVIEPLVQGRYRVTAWLVNFAEARRDIVVSASDLIARTDFVLHPALWRTLS